MIVAAVLGAGFFALAAYVGTLLGNTVAESLQRFEDGPRPEVPPTRWLLAGSALIGAVAATHVAVPAQLLLVAIVCSALVAIWCCDVRTGIIPDIFTLVPLGIILAVALWAHEWWIFVSTIIPFVPFAIAATLSRGRGMGWGDVKLAALGGGVLGAQLSLLVFAVACIVAVVVARVTGRKAEAIAFAPYLAAAIGLAMPIGMFR
jgi:prepilin signal peptidase PulO-like enzyme (type II secretory pathway)